MEVVVIVVIVEQRSGESVDHVDQLLRLLCAMTTTHPFERTSGAEVQGVLEDPVAVVGTTLALVHLAAWNVGIGVGPVEQPMPASVRAGHGPAFTHARTAVRAAGSRSTHLAVSGTPSGAEHAADTEAVLDLLALSQQRRSPEGWEAVTMMVAGMAQTGVAEQLHITKQAVSQRLRAAGWAQDRAGRRTAARLLARADRTHRDPAASGGMLLDDGDVNHVRVGA